MKLAFEFYKPLPRDDAMMQLIANFSERERERERER